MADDLTRNCEPGDLAMLVRNCRCNRCIEGMVGKVVVRLTRPGTLRVIDIEIGDDGVSSSTQAFAIWLYEGDRVHCPHGQPFAFFLDADLMPIRDQPGDDEMLRIAGKPTELPIVTRVLEPTL